MHSQINKLFKVIFLSAIALFSLNSYAENSKEFGDYVVHYNAFRSDTISPEVAKQHGLARANNRVLINIALLKKVLNTTGKPTAAKVSGHASNLTGQLKQLEFKEITEGNAIYYLAETKISDGEFLKFDLKIIPEGETRAARLQFDKRFFTY
ncbi:MAG: DUF4426 domain-containing protein [Gammaproteobacteria bacterium]|nr:DUF4426 domain-containing protein [Gammaproteobacteria bacterium]MBT8135019.1 DUF4426 domain-containing protein [Gammaproteobacteria bacterium]NNJ51166.1 DUF4426 domain-containing protein [Gammaproteobacteria bacterium]